ncbi:unnamed protein product [Haemonchus placei]|uniref:Reverse transcriptase domain-containing protein n=1 Tax=Haemonchus placei TaxID=6290 RepID=A0A0N4W0S2_HAEPC|nr:unnamed protein product [Haemonchus placei]
MQLRLPPGSQAKCGAYFSRAMARILAGLEGNCLAYLDDIVIFDKDFPSHLESLRKVFYRFRLHNIKASGNFYSPAQRNISAIQDYPKPTSTKAVKGFVGMANFFRKFIPNFVHIAAPLYALLKDQEPPLPATRPRKVTRMRQPPLSQPQPPATSFLLSRLAVPPSFA